MNYEAQLRMVFVVGSTKPRISPGILLVAVVAIAHL